MINIFEVNETNKMIEQENLDVRTITMGISLLDCMDSDLAKTNENTIKESKIISGYVGKDYEVNIEDISGYVFVNDSGNIKGKMTNDTIVITLKYANFDIT